MAETTSVCEVDFNPLVGSDRSDPHAFYEWALNNNAPVVYASAFGMYLVTTYEHCQYVLEHPETFASQGAVPPLEATNPPDVLDTWLHGEPAGRNIVEMDPPDHQDLRTRWGSLLQWSRIATVEPFMRQQAADLVAGFDVAQADLVSGFAYPYVRAVLARLVGVPANMARQMVAWNDLFMTLLAPAATEDQRREIAPQVAAYDSYIRQLLTERRDAPQDDMLSDIASAVPEKLSLPDAVMLVRGLWSGGIHTTVHGIVHTLHMLLQSNLWHATASQPETIPNLVEEVLQRQAPLRGLGRRVQHDVTLAGVELPEGAIVAPLLGSAGHEAHQSGCPASRHLAFGHGRHRCLGQKLARLEIRVAVEELTQRVRQPQLPPEFQPSGWPSFFFWGLEKLPVQFTSPSSPAP